MTTVLNGLLGGLLVGVIGAMATQLVAGQSWTSGTSPDRPETERTGSSRWLEPLLLVVYGTVGGVIFVLLELYVLGILAIPPTVGEAFSAAIGWAVVMALVWVVVRFVGRRTVSSSPFDRPRIREIVVFHVVYGLGFGVWIRFTWIT